MEYNDFFDLKTDLADESDEILRSRSPSVEGVRSLKRKIGDTDVFELTVEKGRGETLSGKKSGRYITVSIGKSSLYDSSVFERSGKALAEVFGEFIDKSYKSFLVVGLGNPRITADSVGSHVISSFIVTRHIKETSPDLFLKFGFSETSAITPDVFGNTGVEAAEIIKGVSDDIKPSCVIVIDALSSRSLSRLGGTVQICDTGIRPGSGVGNARAEISRETLGVPVVAIGIPTVVNASTLISDTLCDCGIHPEKLDPQTRKLLFQRVGDDCYVSPKDCEKDIKSISRMVAYALNSAIHKGISFSEMRDFL